MYALLVRRALMVTPKCRSSWCVSSAALRLGGVGGREDVTLRKVRAAPRSAGTNHTTFIRGTAEAEVTSRGVSACPTTRPNGLDNPVVTRIRSTVLYVAKMRIGFVFEKLPKMAVATGRCFSQNQCWLTLAGTLAISGLARPVIAWPTNAIQYLALHTGTVQATTPRERKNSMYSTCHIVQCIVCSM